MARVRMNINDVAGQYAKWQRYARSQPSWVLVAAVSAGLLMVFGFIVLLMLLAGIGFVIVFLPLAILYRAGRAIREWFGPGSRGGAPRDDGRRNVRVIGGSDPSA